MESAITAFQNERLMIPATGGNLFIKPLQKSTCLLGGAMHELKRTPIWKIVAAWTLVLVPLAWGVAYSVKNAIHIFALK
jgi:hypothetical protein